MLKSSEISSKIKTYNDLRDVVNAMKTFAGLNMRKAADSLSYVSEYEGRLKDALGILTFHHPEISSLKGGGKRLVVVFGSDIGLCGAFNNRLAEFTSRLDKQEDRIFVIGNKLKAELDERGLEYIGSRPSAATVEGIRTSMLESFSGIAGLYARQEITGLAYVSFCFDEKSRTPEIASDRILPTDIRSKEIAKDKPLMYLSPETLFNELIGEFLYISLYRCYMESIRAENWFRFRSMGAALDNVEVKIDEYDSLYRYSRQEEITEEIIEIIQSHSMPP